MKMQSMEDRYFVEWDITTPGKLFDKLFKDGIGNESCKDLLAGEKLVIFAYALGKMSSNPKVNLKTSQLRRFYDSLSSINAMIKSNSKARSNFKAEVYPEILKLKPQLAYTYSRHTREFEPFFTIVNPLLDRVQELEDFRKFHQYIEAVVAYHKFCGGRD